MSNIVGTIELNVIPNSRTLIPSLQNIIKQAERSIPQLKVGFDTKGTNSGAAAVQKANESVQKSVQNTVKSVSEGSSQMVQANSRVGASFSKMATGAVAAAASIFILKKGIEVTLGTFSGLLDGLKKAEIGFSILAGPQAGGALLQEIRLLAKETPFATDILLKYSQQLLGVGVASQSITPLLENVGDLVASRGGTSAQIDRTLFALSQIKAAGRLIGQDALQLQNALIPITQLLAKDLGITTQAVKDLQKSGLISSEQVFKTISNAGQEVTGAMVMNVKTIEGASEVLTDAVLISLQDSTIVRGIYDNIVDGLLSLADFVDSDRIQDLIAELSVAGEGLYEALAPIVEDLGGVTFETFLTFLEVSTPLIKLLADGLNALPQPILTALAAFFIVQQYTRWLAVFTRVVSAVGRFSAFLGVLGTSTTASTVATKLNTKVTIENAIANEKAARAVKARQSAMIVAGGLAAAGFVAGKVADETEGSVSSVANGSQYALTGAAIGLAIGGPLGLGIGASAGAGIGIITTVLEKERIMAEQRADDWAKTGSVIAESYTEAFNKELLSADNIEAYRLTLQSVADARILATVNGGLSAENQPQNVVDAAERRGVSLENSPTILVPGLGQTQEEIEALNAVYDTLDTNALTAIEAEKGALDQRNFNIIKHAQDVTKAVLELGIDGFGAGFMNTDHAVGALMNRLEEFGIDIADLDTNNLSAMPVILEATTAQFGRARMAAEEFNEAFTANEDILKDLISEAITQVETNLEVDSNISSFRSAIAEIGADAREGTLDVKDMGEAIADTLSNASSEAARDGTGVAGQAQIITDGFNQVRVASGLSKTEFDAWIESVGSLPVYSAAAAQSIIGMTSTLGAFQEQANLSDEQVRMLLGGIDAIPTDIQLYITADVQQALDDIQRVKEQLLRLTNLNAGDGPQSINDLNPRQADRIANVESQANKEVVNFLDTISVPKPKAASGGSGKSSAEKAADEAKRLAEAVAAANINAVESLTGALQSAADEISKAADEWKDSLKERVQYERSISVSRATKNAGRQIEDLTFLRNGIDELASRGLSDAALTGLGIDGIEDVRQVKKLLRASDSELQTLSQDVTTRDSLANQIAENRGLEQTKKVIILAIVEAAKILGLDIDDNRAAQIQAEFNITSGTDAEEVANEIFDSLTNGTVSR